MKRLFVLLALFISIKLSAPPGYQVAVILRPEPLTNLDAIWAAVCQVESSGNRWAVNFEKGGHSVGIAQIRQVRIEHYNRLTGKDYILQDAFDPEVSREIFMYFARQIGNEDKLIRAWNGSGAQTVEYLGKVKARL